MKYILLFILFVCSSNIIKAQDTLSMRSGENILVKVIEVGTVEVKYKKLDNLNGPIFSILKSDLLIIKYENGTKDDFSSIKKNVENNIYLIDDSVQGKNDAQRFYNGYKTAGNAVVATGNSKFSLFAEVISLVMYICYVYWSLELNTFPIWIAWVSEWIYWIFLFIPCFFFLLLVYTLL